MGSTLSFYYPAPLPSVSKATQTEWNCPVCHSVQSDTTAVPCGHQFCLGCLLRHTAASPTCPLCSSPVVSARFSVLGRNDFLQCILSPPGEPLEPGGWARRALFRLVYTRPAVPQAALGPAEPPSAGPDAQDEFPADLWAELLHGHEQLLDPVRPWLRQSLDAIYGPQWWEARQVESIALSTLCICGPDSVGLTHMLRRYLGHYTAPLIHGLIHVTMHRCRDAWLRQRSQPALEQEEEEEEEESPAASAGTSSPGGTAGLGDQPSVPELARPGGPGRLPAAPALSGHDQPQPWARQDQPRALPEQHRPWATQDQPRARPYQPRAVPEQDAAAPGPSAPRRGRHRRLRLRPTRRSQRRRAHSSRRPLKVRRRKPRRK